LIVLIMIDRLPPQRQKVKRLGVPFNGTFASNALSDDETRRIKWALAEACYFGFLAFQSRSLFSSQFSGIISNARRWVVNPGVAVFVSFERRD
jgi:hypothetical protein